MDPYLAHTPVLKEKILDFFCEDLISKSFFADLTFGGGGHSLSLLNQSSQYKVLAFDQDKDAYQNGLKIIKEKKLKERLHIEHKNFLQFPEIIKKDYPHILEDYQGFSGILMDLGVSSHQLDNKERGFSFRHEASLDMRMNTDQKETAYDLVNNLSQEDLEKLLIEFAQERFYKNIARNIVQVRKDKKIETTKDLENIVFHSYPKKMRFSKIHPATKTFQALRLAINRELEVLSEVIPQLFPLLKVRGKLAIISFHSLEDRIVKRIFLELSKKVEFSCRILTKKPIIPDKKEIFSNKRSRSAKLRIIERL